MNTKMGVHDHPSHHPLLRASRPGESNVWYSEDDGVDAVAGIARVSLWSLYSNLQPAVGCRASGSNQRRGCRWGWVRE